MTVADLRPGLVAYLYADAGIYAAVEGSITRANGGERIFPVKLDQGVKKTSIVYSRISGLGDHTMQGPSGLARPRIQIDCWAPTANAAALLADLVKNRIDGFRGSMPYGSNSPQDTITVQGVFFDSERDDYDEIAKLYRVSRDYLIWFEER